MHLSTRSNRLGSCLPAIAFLLTATAPAADNLAVYDDSLRNGFEDRLWPAIELEADTKVHSGVHSIGVDPSVGWQGLCLGHAPLDTTPYASISFWANGGLGGGQRLQVQALVGEADPPPNVYYRFTLQPDTWQQITVPLSLLGAENRSNLTGFWIQLTPNGATNAFYVDDIQFDAKPVPSEAALNLNAVSALRRWTDPDVAWTMAAWCIAGSLVVVTLLLAWLVFLLRRSGLGAPPAPAPLTAPAWTQIGPPTETLPVVASDATVQGRLQSTDPEIRALRDRVAAELAAFAKQSLIQGLYAQRGELLETQQRAREELDQLEARLAALHLPLQERIRAYETRIGELEKELETRSEEMRNLIHATLLLIRGRLEAEKAGEPGVGQLN